MNNDFFYKEIYKLPVYIMLNVTDNCNLACKYCFVEQHPHYMSLDIAKKAIDWTYNNYIERKEKKYISLKNENPSITFFGGEPLLCFDSIIKPVVEYSYKKYNDIVKFSITTNCTLLTKEIIDFLDKYNIAVLASIDGAEETQCYNRPCRNGDNSSKLIEQNIKYLLEKFPNTIFRSTLYAPTIHHLFENYLYAESLGFKRYVLAPDEISCEWSEEQLNTLDSEFNKIMLYKLEKELNNEPTVDIPIFRPAEEGFYELTGLKEQKQKKDPLRRCGLGTNSCAIGWDGNIYGCQQDVSQDNKGIMLIGNLNNGGIDEEKHKILLKKYFYEINNQNLHTVENENCKTCLLYEVCKLHDGYDCVSNALKLFNKFNINTNVRCRWAKILFQHYLIYNNIMCLKGTPVQNNDNKNEVKNSGM